MSGQWKGSRRREELPPDWEAIKARVFERDGHRCVWVMEKTGRRCTATWELECDHIDDNRDHRMSNLRTLCSFHHGIRTAQQGIEASRRRRAEGLRQPEGRPDLR